jgi:hypothetical protein
VTIQRGEEWGVTVERPATLVLAGDDAALARLVLADRHGCYGLSGGDVFRSLGSPEPRDPVQRLPMDALAVAIDDRELLAVAHVIVRRGWWRGSLLAVMNADHVGSWNVAPRAHPNDGRFDVVEVDAAMSLRDRWQARGRLPHGTHVPHPHISVRTATERSWSFPVPRRVWIDGVAVGAATRLAVRVLPDHFEIHV